MDFATILKLLQFLPTLISLVETFHPAATPGAQKLSAVVSMVNAALPAAQATVTAAPENQPKVETVINALVAGMNAAGIMPSAVPAQVSE